MRTAKRSIPALLTGVCVTSLLAACAQKPVPKEQLAVGQASVEAAQTAGAGELAPVELNRAREKMAQATTAAQNKDYVLARRLAEEANADAQVARTKANAERSRRAADEITAGLRTLRQQLDKGNDSGLMPTAPAAGNPPNAPPQSDSPKSNPDNPGNPASPR